MYIWQWSWGQTWLPLGSSLWSLSTQVPTHWRSELCGLQPYWPGSTGHRQWWLLHKDLEVSVPGKRGDIYQLHANAASTSCSVMFISILIHRVISLLSDVLSIGHWPQPHWSLTSSMLFVKLSHVVHWPRPRCSLTLAMLVIDLGHIVHWLGPCWSLTSAMLFIDLGHIVLWPRPCWSLILAMLFIDLDHAVHFPRPCCSLISATLFIDLGHIGHWPQPYCSLISAALFIDQDHVHWPLPFLEQ